MVRYFLKKVVLTPVAPRLVLTTVFRKIHVEPMRVQNDCRYSLECQDRQDSMAGALRSLDSRQTMKR